MSEICLLSACVSVLKCMKWKCDNPLKIKLIERFEMDYFEDIISSFCILLYCMEFIVLNSGEYCWSRLKKKI